MHRSCIDDSEDTSYYNDLYISPSSFFSMHSLLTIIDRVETQKEPFIFRLEMRNRLICFDCAVRSCVNRKHIFELYITVGFALRNIVIINVVFAVQEASMDSLLAISAIEYIWEAKNEIGLTGGFALLILFVILWNFGLGHLCVIYRSEGWLDKLHKIFLLFFSGRRFIFLFLCSCILRF